MQQSRNLVVATALAAVTLLVPQSAGAVSYLVSIGGILRQTPTNPPGTLRLDLPQLDQGGFFSQFLLDGTSPATMSAPPGGVGEANRYFSALVGMQFVGPGLELISNPGGSSQLIVFNDVGANPRNPNARVDQVTFNTGTVFADGMAIQPFDIALAPDFGFPENIYVSSFAFGRSLAGTVDAPPQLITSADFPALDQVWSNPGTFIFSLQFRQGNPTTPAEQAALPVAFFQGGLQFVEITRFESAIPEPATWGLMIAGFGMIGGTLRRQRRHTLAA